MGESPKPSLKDKAMGWINKPKEEKIADVKGSYVVKGAEEVAVATGLTPAVREVGGAGKKAINMATEGLVDVASAVDRTVDKVEGAVVAAGAHLSRAKEVYDKYNDPKAFGARILERGKALVDKVAAEPLDWAEREGVSRIETFFDEKVSRVIEVGNLLFSDKPRAEAGGNEGEVDNQPLATAETEAGDPRLEVATSVVEGSALIDLVSEGMEAAIQFDQLPNSTGITIADRLLGGENAEVAEQAAEVASLKEKVIESRGEKPDISWDHERRLINRSEARQKEAMETGLEILDNLPESAEDLTNTDLLGARAKGIALVRKNKGMINALTSVARSVELRFPDKGEDVRAELIRLTTPLHENDEVAKSIDGQVDVQDFVRASSGELYMTLIKGNEIFGKLSKENQDKVTAELGAQRKDNINGRFKYDRYDSEPGSTYDTALMAYAELARVSSAYEAMREHVAQHPEAAGQLVIMAERVIQAKHALKLARNKMQAEMTIKAKEVFDAENAKSLEASNRGQEESDRKGRKDYYSKILDRQAERIREEGPTVKKINKFLAIAGGTAAAAFGMAEAAPVVADLAPQAIEYLIKAYNFITTNFDATIKVAGGAAGVLGVAKLSEFLSGKLGGLISGRSEKLKEETAEANADAATRLQGLLDTLEEGDTRRAELEEIIAGLK